MTTAQSGASLRRPDYGVAPAVESHERDESAVEQVQAIAIAISETQIEIAFGLFAGHRVLLVKVYCRPWSLEIAPAPLASEAWTRLGGDRPPLPPQPSDSAIARDTAV